ncbi:MAG: LamG-like jellyroll fold domain-containing protein [Pseudomonadota bacterium]
MLRPRYPTILLVAALWTAPACTRLGFDPDRSDPCSSVNCDGHGQCENVDGQPRCACEVGFVLDAAVHCVAESPAACHLDAHCDDRNDCTDDRCASGTCQHLPVTGPCDDGLDCTEHDSCDAQGHCTGMAGPGVTTLDWYLDEDGDGFVGSTATLRACADPDGADIHWVAVATTLDCDDDPSACGAGCFPGNLAPDLCDDLDDDCDGVEGEAEGRAWFRDVDGDGFPRATELVVSCEDPDGTGGEWLPAAGLVAFDCDDDPQQCGASCFPSNSTRDLCDALDQNCDGRDGEDDLRLWFVDADGDGAPGALDPVVACDDPDGNGSRWIAGSAVTAFDCDDDTGACGADCYPGNPAQDSCDGQDQDCDGHDGEDLAPLWYRDSDGDGYTVNTAVTPSCQDPDGAGTTWLATATANDCDDADIAIAPGQVETCDGVDNNCQDGIDEGCTIVSSGLLLHLDAAQSDGASFAGASCPVSAPLQWLDLHSAWSSALTGFSSPACGVNSGWTGAGLDTDPYRLSFDGVDDQAAIADPSGVLNSPTFTVEVLMRRRAVGSVNITGTGGIPLEPLVSKGRDEQENSLVDFNYILGITEDGRVGTDLEDASTSLNTPLVGLAALTIGDWHQVAVTYNGITRALVVDGGVDTAEPLSVIPNTSNHNPLGVGRMLNSTGVPAGAFDGDIAVVRLYDHALSIEELRTNCAQDALRIDLSCQGPVAADPGFFETFDSGFAAGVDVGDHVDWFDDDGPIVTPGMGCGDTVGLAPGRSIFNRTASPFDWNDTGLTGVVFEMDFQSSSAAGFDDDRVGWSLRGTSVDSALNFGVQLDPDETGGLNIEGYWDGATVDRRPRIADLTGLIRRDTWYRLRLEVHKLAPTAARLVVKLTELDSGCGLLDVVATGEIADTRSLGSDVPAIHYFTPSRMWPSFKNYRNTSGMADNARFEVLH